jgi:transcriptional regulator with XRE-family HTH domain
VIGRQRLARNLRRLRMARNLSQEELGESAEFHRTFVSQIEREQNNISLDNIERLAAALGVDLLELLKP